MPRRKKTPSAAIVTTDDPSIDPFDDRVLSEDLTKAKQLRRVLDMHKAGASYDAIGAEFSIGHKAVRALVKQAVRSLTAEIGESSREEHVAVAVAQLNDLLVGAMEELQTYKSDAKAFRESDGQAGKVPSPELLIALGDHALHIHDRRIKLLGLNAATKVEASGTALIGLADLQKIQEAMEATEVAQVEVEAKICPET